MSESTLFENLRKFASERFATLRLFPDYLKSIIEHWNEIFFLSIPTLPFVAWWYLGEPPMWIRVGVFLWVLVFSGYYAWRTEFLENRESVEITLYAIRPSIGHYASGESSVHMTLVIAIWNSTGKPTVVTNWKVEIPTLGIVSNPKALSDDEISTKPIAPGARCLCELRLSLKEQNDSEERTQTLREQALEWFVSFNDVTRHERRRAFTIPALGTLKGDSYGYIRLANGNSN